MFFPGARARVLQNCLAGWRLAGSPLVDGRAGSLRLAVSFWYRVCTRACACVPLNARRQERPVKWFTRMVLRGFTRLAVLLLGLCALLRLGMLRYYARIVCVVRVF